MPTITITYQGQNNTATVNPKKQLVAEREVTITWQLSQQPGFAWGPNGIQFKPGWPHGQPQLSAQGPKPVYTLTYQNVAPYGTYAYDVNVTYNGDPVSVDPEIQNDPPPGEDW